MVDRVALDTQHPDTRVGRLSSSIDSKPSLSDIQNTGLALIDGSTRKLGARKGTDSSLMLVWSLLSRKLSGKSTNKALLIEPAMVFTPTMAWRTNL